MHAFLPQLSMAVMLLPLVSVLSVPVVRVLQPTKPLMGSVVFSSTSFLISFLLLFVAAGFPPMTGIAWSIAGVSFFLDLLTVSLLVIISVVILQTILYSPQSWRMRDGFASFCRFGICCMFLTGLVLTNDLLVFLLFLVGMDLGWFLGLETHSAAQRSWRLRRFLLLQLMNLPIAVSFLLLHHWNLETRFTAILAHAAFIDPRSLSWFLLLLFTAVGLKTSAFPTSFWVHAAENTTSSLLHFPLIQGINSVLPGLYLLSRLNPTFQYAIIPIPLLMALAVCLGFATFIAIAPFPPPRPEK